MVQHLCEGNPDRLMEFCEWAIRKLNKDANISCKILFSDEANFHFNEEVNEVLQRYKVLVNLWHGLGYEGRISGQFTIFTQKKNLKKF